MANKLKEAISRNLRKPEKSVIGWLVQKFIFEKRTAVLEQETARLCSIQPDHHVLEVGFGSGFGLEAAYKDIKDGKGKIYGVDFSEEMVKVSVRRLSSQVKSGKVELINADVMDLSCFPSHKFDRVFHCNCYYFWSDLEKGASELYRVMKPDSIMITTMNVAAINTIQSKGLMLYGDPNQQRYIEALETAGFRDIKLEKVKAVSSVSGKFDAIFSHK